MNKLVTFHPNTLSETKLCNLHPNERRRASPFLLYGSPHPPATIDTLSISLRMLTRQRSRFIPSIVFYQSVSLLLDLFPSRATVWTKSSCCPELCYSMHKRSTRLLHLWRGWRDSMEPSNPLCLAPFPSWAITPDAVICCALPSQKLLWYQGSFRTNGARIYRESLDK